MTPFRLACIVEGHGEVSAFPILAQRLAQAILPERVLITPNPIRVDRGKIVKPHEMERAVRLAVGQARPEGAVLILMDSDDDCPATLGPELLTAAQRSSGDTPVAVVLAHREFEAWFLAAAESLRGVCDMNDALVAPENPEAISGAKGWLKRQMPENRAYSETVDQKVMAQTFDLEAARRNAASFDKLWREMERLLMRRRVSP